MKTSNLVLASMFAFGSVLPAMGQEVTKRTVPETRVAASAMWHIKGGNGRCETRGYPNLTIVTPPSHGTVRFVQGDIGIPEGSGCRNSVYGLSVVYTPAPGFEGQDQFTFNSPREAMGFDWVGRHSSRTSHFRTHRAPLTTGWTARD
jgi:hypothetical protein